MIPDNKGNRILVVGGSGFIGSHVVPRAISMGMDVTFTGTHENKPGLASGEAEYICLDTTDRDAVYHALHGRQFEYVVNCGGYINHAGIHDGGYQVTREHFYSVVNLIEAIPRDSLQCFVNLGSSDEYGSCSAPQRENMREQAISPYSAAKLAATHFLQMLWHSEEFPAVTLRLFLVYGPGQGENRFLPQVILSCIDGRRFPTSTGEQLRDFCYIDDVVRAIFLALNRPSARGEVINIASGVPVPVRDVVATIVREVGGGDPDYGKFPLRTVENMQLFADITKARKLLKWMPEIPFEVGLERTILFFRQKHRDVATS